MNKIEGTIIAASRLESGEQATCGCVIWTTEKQKAEMERWESNGLVVVERKADHDAREAEVKRLREESKILRDGFTGYRETMRCEMGRLISEVERLRDAERQRVAEGMSRWCAPQSPHLDAIAAALEHAKAKHPKFADKLFSFKRLVDCQDYLATWRRQLEIEACDNRTSAKTVLTCEELEAEEAFLLGNYHATMDELAQCGAVVVRMMEAVQALMDGQEQAAKAGEGPIK
jgi:hypothetical protein